MLKKSVNVKFRIAVLPCAAVMAAMALGVMPVFAAEPAQADLPVTGTVSVPSSEPQDVTPPTPYEIEAAKEAAEAAKAAQTQPQQPAQQEQKLQALSVTADTAAPVSAEIKVSTQPPAVAEIQFSTQSAAGNALAVSSDTVLAASASGVAIYGVVITDAVHSKMPGDAITAFPSGTRRIYCWMRLGGDMTDKFTVEWSLDGRKKLSTALSAGGRMKRTWCYKTYPHDGKWSVSITDSAGNVLYAAQFTVGQ